MKASAPQKIAIVGGGFSGTLAAINLARLATSPLKVTLINTARPQGRGIAYGTKRPEHLLNVVARNMSALPDHPSHFLEWLRTRTEFADTPEAELRETFMPRRVYGDYLRSLAHHTFHPIGAKPRVEFEVIEDEAVDLRPTSGGAELTLICGKKVEAKKVLLATGNEPPADLPGQESLANHSAWCANPWVPWESKLPPEGSTIALLGTGLTTVDAIVTLLALEWRGKIVAVSRNGLLPLSHFKGVDDLHFPPPDVDLAKLGLANLVKLLEEHCARLRAAGLNPAMIVDKMRPHTQRIWQAFSDDERREFVAKHSARWNVIRHRIAPSIHRQVTDALESGKLQVVRAGIAGVKPKGDRVVIELRDRDGKTSEIEASLAINCTGPHTRFSATRSTLLQNLLRSGLAQPDSMDMGVRVEPDFSVVERGGKRSAFLYAMGPLLRGTLWESIAVPELRGQALHVAESILGKPTPGHAASAEEAVIEYWI